MTLQELLTETVETPSIEFWDDESTVNALGAFAVRLHSTGVSLRETAAALESIGVSRSHQAIFQWVHRVGEKAPDPPMAQLSRVAVDEHGHDAVKEARDRAFVAMIAYAGVRGGETVRDPNDDRRTGIAWSDVDLENGTLTVLGKGDQAYESVGLPRQALSALERYRDVIEPPNDRWPVFPTLHNPTLSKVVREGFRERDGLSEKDVDAELREKSLLALLRELGFVPLALSTDGARRLMRTLSEEADIPGIDMENDEYLEHHGGRRGAGDTLVREVGWEHAQRLLRHKSPETTMNAYSHISAGEIADDASNAFDLADTN